MISEYCRSCSGEGRVRVKKDIKVKIPPGVGKGSILRVAGEGDAGPKGYVNNTAPLAQTISHLFHLLIRTSTRFNTSLTVFSFCYSLS